MPTLQMRKYFVMKKAKENQEKSNTPEDMVEQAIASMNIEGIRIPEDEKEVLRKIASGELDADEVAEAIVNKALENAKINKPT
ncbi:MAG: antitoxin VbhA family protein [Cellvibrionaceae bacterium]